MARRRGQAALEFLSTYGFAFLLILLMISALSYFGVLSPTKFLPGRCLISNEFRCEDRILNEDTTVTPVTFSANMVIVNQLGNTVVFQSAVANSTIGNGVCSFSTITVTNGAKTTVTCPLTLPAGVASFPAEGEKAKVGFAIVYKELGGTYDRVANGEVADTIQ